MLLLRRASPQVLSYLNAENNYTAAVLAPTANLTAELYAEMAGRIPASDVSDPPQRYKGFYYYEYRVPGGQFMVKARCAGEPNSCDPQGPAWRGHHGVLTGRAAARQAMDARRGCTGRTQPAKQGRSGPPVPPRGKHLLASSGLTPRCAELHAYFSCAETMLLRRRVVPAGAPAASENDEMDVSQPEQVILDPNAMAKASNNPYFELGAWMVRMTRSCRDRHDSIGLWRGP